MTAFITFGGRSFARTRAAAIKALLLAGTVTAVLALPTVQVSVAHNVGWVSLVQGAAQPGFAWAYPGDPSLARLRAEQETASTVDEVQAWDRALATSPDGLTRKHHALALAAAGRAHEAGAELADLGVSAKGLFRDADVALDQGNTTLASGLLTGAVLGPVDPLSAGQLTTAGDRLGSDGHEHLAMVAYERAANSTDGDRRQHAVAFTRLGRLLASAGEISRARLAFASAQQADPSFSPGFFEDGGLVLREHDCVEAAELFRRGAAPGSSNAGPSLTLGFILLHQGFINGARAELHAVVSQAPQNDDARFRLSQALLLSGDRSGALREIDEAIRLNPQQAYQPWRERVLRDERRLDGGVC